MTNIGLKIVKRVIKKLLLSLVAQPLPPVTNRDNKLIEELRSIFRELPCMTSTSDSPSEQEWLNNIKHLRKMVLNHDPRKFLTWDIILKTMFVDNKRYIRTELDFLKILPNWANRWCEAILESPFGHPIPYWKYPRSSGNLIHHAYHIAQFEQKTEIDINTMNFIFEFGGGYGSMCRLFHNLGFQGKYVLFDLPHFSALQQFYLKSSGIDVQSIDSFHSSKSGVFCTSDLELLTQTLLNHNNLSDSMFIATWSISETPVYFRNSILSLTSQFKGYLIGYQAQFREVNNIDFFSNWKTTQKNVEWFNWEIEHLKHNSYLIGRRKGCQKR